MRRFDKQRPGPQDQQPEWVNPNDPDAKVAKAKDGATDMLYKPEHIVDLDTGAIVSAEVRQADAADGAGWRRAPWRRRSSRRFARKPLPAGQRGQCGGAGENPHQRQGLLLRGGSAAGHCRSAASRR